MGLAAVQITIDEKTRLIQADSVSFGKGKGRKPFNFASDKALILNSFGQPVAKIEPVAVGTQAAAPVMSAAPSEDGDGAPKASGQYGRLLDSQVEQLQRLWMTNKGRRRKVRAGRDRGSVGQGLGVRSHGRPVPGSRSLREARVVNGAAGGGNRELPPRGRNHVGPDGDRRRTGLHQRS